MMSLKACVLYWICWMWLPNVVDAATLTQQLSAGVCLCINEQNVNAISDPSDPTSVVATLINNACFKTYGGVYHKGSITYYQLQDNGQTAWVDSYYLNIVDLHNCGNYTEYMPYHTPDGQAANCLAYGKSYIHGEQFTLHGLECICDDGATLCSLTGRNCYSGGIVYLHGTAFDISGRGSCTCTNGHVHCNPVVG